MEHYINGKMGMDQIELKKMYFPITCYRKRLFFLFKSDNISQKMESDGIEEYDYPVIALAQLRFAKN